MATLNEARYSKIANKVIRLEDARKIAALIAEEATLVPSDDGRRLSFLAVRSRASSIESADPAIFSSLAPVSLAQIVRVEFRFVHFSTGASVEVVLDQEAATGYYAISGPNRAWVDCVAGKLESVLASVSPQNTFVRKYAIPLNLMLGIGIARLFAFIAEPLFAGMAPPDPDSPLVRFYLAYPWLIVPSSYLFAGIFGISPALLITDRLARLWPSVEIRIGPEDMQIRKQRRIRLWFVASLIVVPVLLELLA